MTIQGVGGSNIQAPQITVKPQGGVKDTDGGSDGGREASESKVDRAREGGKPSAGNAPGKVNVTA